MAGHKKWAEIKRDKGSTDEMKLCPRCWRRMTWLENEDGSFQQWCIHCQAPFIDKNSTDLFEK